MLLAIDSSTLTLSLALTDGARLVEHVAIGPPTRISVALPDEVLALLGRHQLTLAQVSGFAVGLGPGSFTGLRISLAAVKGFAYALDKPVVGVSSLAAVALDGPEGITLFASAVVKKGELYLGRYRREGGAVTLLAPEEAMTVARFAEAMAAEPGALAIGPAMTDYAAPLQALGVDASRCLPTVKYPSAAAIARLARLPATWDKRDAFALEPHYLRSSGAEDNPKFPPLPGLVSASRLKED